jgi:hypothetical protein
MANTSARLPAHVAVLLEILREPAACAALTESQWDVLVRTARSARLLGVLAVRVEADRDVAAVPARVADHFRAARAQAAHLRQMVLRQLAAIADTLRPLHARLVALKGAAYVLRNHACAAGRLPSDLDVMVGRDRLDEAERLLAAAGWEFTKTEAYDQRYYREWSHELPPMRAPAMPLELDLHHAILPPLGRVRPDSAEFLAAAVPAEGEWWTPCPADVVLHAVAHLFQDSDCVNRLRDLVDIDSLLREALAADPNFPAVLSARAERLGLETPLWYAVEFAQCWLGTPLHSEQVAPRAPAWPGRAAVVALASRCLYGVHPDAEPGRAHRVACQLMAARAQWLRMPPRLLAFHATSKLLRSLRPQPASA